ncbi:MAG: proton-conducting transporter membrane subunit [Janthinobacterium lividum]
MISHSLLIPLVILIASLNLLIPFVSKNRSFMRSFLLIISSLFFFLNILILDWFFLKRAVTSISLFNIGNYCFALHVEPYGLVFLNLLAFLWVYSLLYTLKYLEINNKNQDTSLFLFFMNLCVVLSILLALSANLFTMFVSYELLTLATIPLIMYERNEEKWAGLYKYLSTLMVSSLILFLPAIIVIYHRVGHGNFIIEGFIQNYFHKGQSMILLLMFIFGISKAALYPLCRWLPAAMVANYPTSALLHAVVVVKAGLFCIFKILTYVFGLSYLHSIFADFNWILIFPALTIIYSSFKALGTDNIKTILAYSTINQLSISLLSAFMFTSKSVSAAIFHMISHSFTKICLFYCAGIFYSLKRAYSLQDLQNLGSQAPASSFIFLLASLSLIGIPPFGGFISKFLIIIEALRQNQMFVVVILGFSGIFSALYMWKINAILFDSNIPSTAGGALRINYVPMSMNITISSCAIIIILFFLIYKFVNQFLQFS